VALREFEKIVQDKEWSLVKDLETSLDRNVNSSLGRGKNVMGRCRKESVELLRRVEQRTKARVI
jgi:hypothetical protein